MAKLHGLFNLLLNKYVISIIVFLVWISFCDRNDLVTQWERKQELNKLEQSENYYLNEIENTNKYLSDLNNNPATLEKIAREKFYLKRSNEQVFLIIKNEPETKEKQ